MNYGYTIRDWVKSINDIANADTEGTFAAEYNYYDNGNVKNADFYNPNTGPGGAQNRFDYQFSYDGLSRLTGADYSDSDAVAGAFDVDSLTYDKAGNLGDLKRWDDSGANIDDLEYIYYDGTNRLKELKDPSGQQYSWDAGPINNFNYDTNGNLLSRSDKLGSVTYEHRNLPNHFSLDNGNDIYASYNVEGQRVLKEHEGGDWTFYVMDGLQTIAVIKNGTLSHINLVGNATFGRINADANGDIDVSNSRRYYIKDALRSTRIVVDETGQVKETFDYYPFGLLMPKRNTTNSGTLEKFTGKERDTEGNLNLDYFGARYYDPALGRWHNVDPLAEKYPEWSPYTYALNNPMVFVDPDGKQITISYNCTEGEDGNTSCEEFKFTGDNIEEGRELDNEFVNNFLDAYEFAVGNGGSENLEEAATNDDINIALKHFGNGGDYKNNVNSYYDNRANRKAVYWLPKVGLKTDIGTLSPATVLEHEMAHAVDDAKNPRAHLNRSGGVEEQRVISGAEFNAARSNGEIGSSQITRYRHEDGHAVVTQGPTTNKINRQATFSYYQWFSKNTSREFSKLLQIYKNKR